MQNYYIWQGNILTNVDIYTSYKWLISWWRNNSSIWMRMLHFWKIVSNFPLTDCYMIWLEFFHLARFPMKLKVRYKLTWLELDLLAQWRRFKLVHSLHPSFSGFCPACLIAKWPPPSTSTSTCWSALLVLEHHHLYDNHHHGHAKTKNIRIATTAMMNCLSDFIEPVKCAINTTRH